jgi:hypothetical protein
MSLVYYDHLVSFENLEKKIGEAIETVEEREELWQLIDEIVHHRVLDLILGSIPEEYHYEFLTMVQTCPYDDQILPFADQFSDDNLEDVILQEVENLENEIVEEIFGNE